MKTIGIRELKNNLSRMIRRVESGESIDVTDRGRVVAHLSPPVLPQRRDRYEELVATGVIVPAAEAGNPLADWPPRGRIRAPKGIVAELIEEDRGI